MKSLYPLAVLMAGLAASMPVLSNLPPAAINEVNELVAAGRTTEALRNVDALLAKFPDEPQLRFQKGVLLVDLKRTTDAITVFERMSRDFPTLPEPMNNLAVLYAEQGQIEKARAALESAVRSRPSYNTAYENLSSLNVRLASRAYARALQIDDSGGAPKLAMLKTLAGSRADNSPVMVAVAAPPAPAPAPPAPAVIAAPPSPVAVEPPRPAAEQPAAARPAPPRDVAKDPAATAAKPRPVTADTSQRNSNDEAREVRSAVEAWAEAWEKKDMNGYIGSYVPGFSGSDSNASRWQEGRRQRILGKARISVELAAITVELLGEDRAKVSFRQNYSADELNISGQKVLELVKRNGKWLIRKESVGT